MRAGPGSGEIRNEKAAARQAPLQPCEQATSGIGVHVHAVVHPGHGVGLAVDGFTGREVYLDGLHDGSGNLVFHDGLRSAGCSLDEHMASRFRGKPSGLGKDFDLPQIGHAQALIGVLCACA